MVASIVFETWHTAGPSMLYPVYRSVGVTHCSFIKMDFPRLSWELNPICLTDLPSYLLIVKYPLSKNPLSFLKRRESRGSRGTTALLRKYSLKSTLQNDP